MDTVVVIGKIVIGTGATVVPGISGVVVCGGGFVGGGHVIDVGLVVVACGGMAVGGCRVPAETYA